MSRSGHYARSKDHAQLLTGTRQLSEYKNECVGLQNFKVNETNPHAKEPLELFREPGPTGTWYRSPGVRTMAPSTTKS